MPSIKTKKSIFARLRNYFLAGVVVLIPIGITLYLTLFIIKISSKILPKEINPNNYLPFDIIGLEILIAVILITLIGWISLSFLGKKIIDIINNILKRIPILRTIYSAIGQMTESLTKSENNNLEFYEKIVNKNFDNPEKILKYLEKTNKLYEKQILLFNHPEFLRA